MLIELEQCARILSETDDILFLCHRHPDGDTLGSASALVLALTAAGKNVALHCEDKIPRTFEKMLEGVNMNPSFEPKLIAAVDVADTTLLGTETEAKYADSVALCIDHHGSNKQYAKAVWLCPESASTAEMIFRLLESMGLEITPQIASCLFTGVSTDTGCFRFSNTTPDTHRIAARLMEYGADAQNIIQVCFETKSRAYSNLERLALDDMRLYLGGRAAVIAVTRTMFGISGADESDTDRLANLPRQIEGVLVGVTMRELEDGSFKASVRTHGDVDASEICRRLGGGGHKGAAGCTLKMTKQQAINTILGEIEKELDSSSAQADEN